MAKRKAEPLEGWRLHPKAANVCVFLIFLTSMIGLFGEMVGLTGSARTLAMMPGIASGILMTFQYAAIWQRVENE